MIKISTLLLGASFLMGSAHAQLASWNVFGQTAYGTQNLPPSAILADLAATPGLTRDAGVTTNPSAGANLWGGNGWTFGTTQNGIDSLKFVTFGIRNISTNPANALLVTGLDTIRIRVSSSGPINYTIQARRNTNAFTDISTQSITRPGSTANFILTPVAVPATIGALNIGDSIVFRIIPSGTNSAAGTFYIGNQSSRTHLSILGAFTLPATLRNLSALVQNHQTRISFEASNEVNVANYSIEQSTDNRSFSTIATLEARGGGLYSYSHTAPTTTTWFRIRTNDKDGRQQLSHVVAVHAAKTLSIKLSPNPVQNQAIISFPAAMGEASISIVDMNGRRIQTHAVSTGTTQLSLDLSKLVAGQYLVQMTDGTANSSIAFSKQ